MSDEMRRTGERTHRPASASGKEASRRKSARTLQAPSKRVILDTTQVDFRLNTECRERLAKLDDYQRWARNILGRFVLR
jgi:hypothetical protein